MIPEKWWFHIIILKISEIIAFAIFITNNFEKTEQFALFLRIPLINRHTNDARTRYGFVVANNFLVKVSKNRSRWYRKKEKHDSGKMLISHNYAEKFRNNCIYNNYTANLGEN